MNQRIQPRDFALLGMLTMAALLLHGYHLGVQDQAIYLPAIKKALDPSLYPFDAQFFLSQTQWMYTNQIIVWLTRLSGISLEWVMFLFHIACVYLVLLG